MEQVAQTSEVYQILNNHSAGTNIKHTKYEGEQHNISIGGCSTEKSKMAEVDIGRIHTKVGIAEKVHHHSNVSHGAQYEAHASGEALDVTVLASGKNTTCQSGSGEFLQFKSVWETAESLMEQVAQTSGVHQILNTHSAGTQVKHTEYEGEQAHYVSVNANGKQNVTVNERGSE